MLISERYTRSGLIDGHFEMEVASEIIKSVKASF